MLWSQHRWRLLSGKGVDWCGEGVGSCYYLLTYRSYVLENQSILSSEAMTSGLTRIGIYELLEKKNEGYETN